MFGSQILEVAIGVIFIFVLVSIMCSVVREGIEAWLKTRAAFLEHGIRELLHDKEATGLARSFYQHPLIYSLFSAEYQPKPSAKRPSAFTSGGTLPSYIPTKNFALALLDMAARGPRTDAVSSDPESTRISLESIRQNVENLGNPAVQRVVLTALDTAQGDLNQAQANLEAWYDSGMDRVSGWYKRSSQWVIFWIGLGMAIALNINTITIADYLAHNDVARQALVAQAEAATKDPAYPSRGYSQVQSQLSSLDLPIGWGKSRQGYQAVEQDNGLWGSVFGPLFGWLLTALAAMLGAPFWFDILNKVMVIRSTVKPHEKSQEEASEDRQLPPAAPAAPAPTAVVPPAARPKTPPAPPEAGHDLDGCDVEAEAADLTADEDLPAATGGVQISLQPAPVGTH